MRRQGTSLQAIKFAVTIDDHYDRLSFLEEYLKGNLEPDDWPDYFEDLKRPHSERRGAVDQI